MPAPRPLSRFLGLACFAASGAALAGDWHVCMTSAGTNEFIEWQVTQPFDAAGIDDWAAQFEALKDGQRARAGQKGLEFGEEGFQCSVRRRPPPTPTPTAA
jgi:hypothetical protein